MNKVVHTVCGQMVVVNYYKNNTPFVLRYRSAVYPHFCLHTTRVKRSPVSSFFYFKDIIGLQMRNQNMFN